MFWISGRIVEISILIMYSEILFLVTTVEQTNDINSDNNKNFDLIIVGSGPVGLSAAIAAKRKGLDAVILEKGILCNAIYQWPTQWRFFTEAKLLEIGNHAFPSSEIKPTRQRALDYYRRVTEIEELNVKQHHEVVDISGEMGNFTVTGKRYRHNKEYTYSFKSKFILIATGYFSNPIGLGGIPGEDKPIVSNYYQDPHPYFQHDVVVIGAGNSGAETSLELYRHGANVTLVHKHPEPKSTIKYWIRPDLVNRIKDGDIKAVMSAETTEIRDNGIIVNTPKEKGKFIPADKVFIQTGYTPEVEIFKKWGMEINEDDLSVKMNMDTFETTNSGMYVCGSAGFGANTSRVFIENGRFHAEIAIDTMVKKLNSTVEAHP